MLDSGQQETVAARLARVEQQIHVIRKMIQEPAICADLLAQLAQAEAALSKVSASILKMSQTGAFRCWRHFGMRQQ